MGKTMVSISNTDVSNPNGYTYTNAKGGLADIAFKPYNEGANLQLIVDGVTILNGVSPMQHLKACTDNTHTYELKIPFTSTFTIIHYCGEGNKSSIQGFVYLNK